MSRLRGRYRDVGGRRGPGAAAGPWREERLLRRFEVEDVGGGAK